MNFIMTIAASDNSGGAGIQKDILIADKLNFWGISAITGITVQNFDKVSKIVPVKSELLKMQIENCYTSFNIKATKIGAICSYDNLLVIIDSIKKFKPFNIVLDPIIAASSGEKFLDNNSIKLMKNELFPLMTIITPNKDEFEIFTKTKIQTIKEAIDLAKIKSKEWNTSILLKGGHFFNKYINEALISNGIAYYFERKRENFKYSHGTGCTLSTAIACYLANNYSLKDAYLLASEFLLNHYKSIQKIIEKVQDVNK